MEHGNVDVHLLSGTQPKKKRMNSYKFINFHAKTSFFPPPINIVNGKV